MKKTILTTLVALSSFGLIVSEVHAQAATSAVLGGTASCAVGSYVSSMIAKKIGGLFGGGSSGGGGGITDAIGGGSDAVPVNAAYLNDKAATLEQKNFTLDRLASCAAKQILHQMTADTINWINTGFKGGPAFLTNPRGFLLDTADQLTGEMISDGGALQGLCSPWNVDVRLTLALEQAGGQFDSTRYTCTLSRIVKNAQNANVAVDANAFIGGDFSQGGWDSFMDMTVGSDNPMAQYLQAKSALQSQIAQKQTDINDDLNRGSGFMSYETCETVNLQTALGSVPQSLPGDSSYIKKNPDGKTGQRCTTRTPGSEIAHILNVHTDSGVVEAELANDINSIVDSLITQLTSQILTKGLSALSSSGSGVSTGGGVTLDSYINQLQVASAQGQTVTSDGTTFTIKNGSVTSSGDSVTALYSNVISALQTVKDTYSSALSCYATLKNQTGNPNSASAQTRIDTIQTNLDSKVNPLLSEASTRLAAASQNTAFTAADTTAAKSYTDTVFTQAQSYLDDARNFQTDCQTMLTH